MLVEFTFSDEQTPEQVLDMVHQFLLYAMDQVEQTDEEEPLVAAFTAFEESRQAMIERVARHKAAIAAEMIRLGFGTTP